MLNPLAPFLGAVGDTLANLVTGMGGRGDKATATTWLPSTMTPQECEDAYRGDWLARKIVTIPASDSTRAWRAWQATREQIEAIEAEEKRLGVRAHVTKGRRLARLHGGAAIIMGDGAADTAKPLDPEKIGKGGLKYLLTLACTKVTAGDLDWTPGLNYGLPLTYTLTPPSGAQLTLHHTRVVRFIGADVPDETLAETKGWGDSVLVAVRDALQAAGTSTQAVAALLLEAKVDVVKVPGLLEKVGNPKDKEQLLARFSLAALAKGLHGVLITDAKEEWEQKQVSFANLPETLDRFLQIAAGAADIPATRLLGQSPAGMNATGESDLRNYYDRLASEQENEITPALAPLDEALIRSALGSRPPEIHYRWNPLWQLTDKEKADIADKKADTVKKHKETGLIPLPALAQMQRNQLIEDGVYPGAEAAFEEADAAEDLAPYEEPLPDPLAGGVDPRTGKPLPAAPKAPTRTPRRDLPAARAANDAQTSPLYVSRPVANAAAIIQWAREQGFKTTIPADQLHVTLAYSTRPVDWGKLEADSSPLTITVDNGREDGLPAYRWVTRLGDDGAVVLMFEAHQLRERWQAIIDAGASWDHDHFWPHITLSYDAGDYLEPWNLSAYLGPVDLGAERFDVLDVDTPASKPREVSTEGGTN